MVQRKYLWLTVQAVVTTVLLALLARSLDLTAFRTLFVRLPIWFYAASLAVMMGGQVMYAWRWRLLLVAAGAAVPFSAVVRQYFIGTFVNNFFPSTVGGDLTKVYYLGREHGYRVVTASVVLDRILGIGLLAMFSSAALWPVRAISPVLVAAHAAVAVVAAFSLVLLLLAAIGTGGLPDRVARLGPHAVSAARHLQDVRCNMAAPLAKPVIIAQAAAVVAVNFVAVTAVYVVFVALVGERSTSFIDMFAVVTAVSVLTHIPISLNGLGLREQLHAVLLGPLGVSPELAVAISLLLFGHLVISSLIGLMLWLRAPAVDLVAS